MFGIDIIGATLSLALLLAFAGGLLSFLSPCVFPVALPYLAYMGGVSVGDMQGDARARKRAVTASVFFVFGLSTVFLILGAAAAGFGRLFLSNQALLNGVAGLIVIAFGLHFVGLYRLRFLDHELRVDAGDQGGSAFGAYLLGLAFAFGWTPCLGPILGGILTLAANQADVAKGMGLLLIYAAGLGLPFILLAAFLPRLQGLMAWMKRHLRLVERLSGGLLILVGVLLLTGQFTVISNWLLTTFPVLQTIG